MAGPIADRREQFRASIDEIVALSDEARSSRVLRLVHLAMSARLPGSARRNAAAEGLRAPRIRALRTQGSAPAAFAFALAVTAILPGFILTGIPTSLFWLVSQGIVFFLLALRKDALSLSCRP